LTSRRAYKEAWSHEQALDYLCKQRGISFNPVLVDAFKALFATTDIPIESS